MHIKWLSEDRFSEIEQNCEVKREKGKGFVDVK